MLSNTVLPQFVQMSATHESAIALPPCGIVAPVERGACCLPVVACVHQLGVGPDAAVRLTAAEWRVTARAVRLGAAGADGPAVDFETGGAAEPPDQQQLVVLVEVFLGVAEQREAAATPPSGDGGCHVNNVTTEP